ncbi:low molecular weight protein-tyrosine-phosphatase [Arenimonas sp. MALMAid1274]|uniref:low molecular weight protein-tyrosine-phosphatase n=1 Tax=Arenimonas sp. MALMAid1274 TaxID=3411630 RepID=UPI003BA3DF85
MYVCMGNICRSPLLEGWARKALADAGRSDRVRVDSAGTGDWHVGRPPDTRAIAVARRHGLDISAQRARLVGPDDFRRYDLMLCADHDNLRWLRRQAPGDATAVIARVLDWCEVGEGGDVPDPYQGDAADFEHVNRLARDAAQGLLRKLPPQA